MTRLTSRTSRGAGRLRVWWALPSFAVAASAVAAGIVVGPTLGETVSIPRQLVLPEASATPPSMQPATPRKGHGDSTAAKPTNDVKAAPKRTPTATPTSWPLQQTRVVAPQRPVVTSTDDDGHDHETGTDVGSGDG